MPPKRKFINYYDVLELRRNATAFDIRHAYLRFRRVLHPDKNPKRQNEDEKEIYLLNSQHIKNRHHINKAFSRRNQKLKNLLMYKFLFVMYMIPL